MSMKRLSLALMIAAACLLCLLEEAHAAQVRKPKQMMSHIVSENANVVKTIVETPLERAADRVEKRVKRRVAEDAEMDRMTLRYFLTSQKMEEKRKTYIKEQENRNQTKFLKTLVARNNAHLAQYRLEFLNYTREEQTKDDQHQMALRKISADEQAKKQTLRQEWTDKLQKAEHAEDVTEQSFKRQLLDEYNRQAADEKQAKSEIQNSMEQWRKTQSAETVANQESFDILQRQKQAELQYGEAQKKAEEHLAQARIVEAQSQNDATQRRADEKARVITATRVCDAESHIRPDPGADIPPSVYPFTFPYMVPDNTSFYITFEAKTNNDLMLALQSEVARLEQGNVRRIYEIVLCADGNSRSLIRTSYNASEQATLSSAACSGSFSNYWVTYKAAKLIVGSGQLFYGQKLVEWVDTSPPSNGVHYFDFAHPAEGTLEYRNVCSGMLPAD